MSSSNVNSNSATSSGLLGSVPHPGCRRQPVAVMVSAAISSTLRLAAKSGDESRDGSGQRIAALRGAALCFVVLRHKRTLNLVGSLASIVGSGPIARLEQILEANPPEQLRPHPVGDAIDDLAAVLAVGRYGPGTVAYQRAARRPSRWRRRRPRGRSRRVRGTRVL